MKTRIRSLNTIPLVFLMFLMSLLPANPVQAQRESVLSGPSVHQEAQGPTDLQELEAFLDAFFAEQMEANHVAGAVVSIVKDGEVFFAKGYGYADVANHKPVDPDTTLFYIGSITKLFTWTAVMQLVEKGQLDLNADVNTYLDFEIPATYPQPIRLAHLMTHTPGFEDMFFGYCAPSAEELRPLGAWLAANIPARVRPPGETAAYTNYAAALAGYIVERASGRSYDKYIEENILEPLGMEHTSSRQPVPDHLASDLALGYGTVDGAFQVQHDPFYFQNDAPAGSIVSTATDMARFMIAHLQNGQYNGARILEQATARQMHSRLFTQDERLDGFAHGFFEYHRGGQRALKHGGATLLFHSDLVLLPEHNVGLFVSTNSESGGSVVLNLVEAFMDRYYPPPQEAVPPFQVSSAQDLEPIAGNYRPANVAPYTTPEKARIIQSSITMQVSGDGRLSMSGLAGQLDYVEVESLVFQGVDAEAWGEVYRMTVRKDERGNVTHVLFSHATFERLPWYETQVFTLLLLAVCLVLFLSVVIAAPIGFIVRRIRGGAGPQPRPARAARWLLGALVVLFFLFVVGFAVSFTDQSAALQGNIPGLKIVMLIPILMVVLTIGAVIFTVLAWKRRYWHVSGRVHYTLVTVVAVALVWFFCNWNLLGW